MLIIDQQDVQRSLGMPAAIAAMRRALIALDRGDALQPLRSSVCLPPEGATCWLMPAYAGAPGRLGVKVLTAFEGNAGSAYETHQGGVLLFGDHGELLALIDATAITAIRTAAVSAVATDALARKDASRLAVLGSGAQALSHLEAMLHVRQIAYTTVWSRNAEHAERFARTAGEKLGVDVKVSATVAATVRDADIICTTTAARAPILDGALVSAGTHINAVGSGSATQRELSSAVVSAASVYVDRIESALHEAGEIVIAIADGTITDAHIIGELGAVLTGRIRARLTNAEITLFKSVGLGVEDVAAASVIHTECLRSGGGKRVKFGAARD